VVPEAFAASISLLSRSEMDAMAELLSVAVEGHDPSTLSPAPEAILNLAGVPGARSASATGRRPPQTGIGFDGVH
jgi:hypothetical protein